MSPSRNVNALLHTSRKLRFPLELFAPFISTLAVASAAAAPLPRLVVVRDSNAVDCPDATELAFAVERQMRRPALDPTQNEFPGEVYTVHIERSPDAYTATIQSGDLTRNLSDAGSTCTELSDALALTLAILLDNDPSPSPPSKPPPLRIVPSTPLKVRSKNPLQHWGFGVDGGVAETIGFLSPFSFALTGDVWVSHRASLFGAGVFAIPLATANETKTASVDLQLVTGTFRACHRLAGQPSGLNVSLCGQSLFGVVHGEGRGYAVNREGTRPWFAMGGMASLERPFFRSLGWFVRLTIAVPIVSQRFIAHRIQGAGLGANDNIVTVFEPPSVAASLGVGLRWAIF